MSRFDAAATKPYKGGVRAERRWSGLEYPGPDLVTRIAHPGPDRVDIAAVAGDLVDAQQYDQREDHRFHARYGGTTGVKEP